MSAEAAMETREGSRVDLLAPPPVFTNSKDMQAALNKLEWPTRVGAATGALSRMIAEPLERAISDTTKAFESHPLSKIREQLDAQRVTLRQTIRSSDIELERAAAERLLARLDGECAESDDLKVRLSQLHSAKRSFEEFRKVLDAQWPEAQHLDLDFLCKFKLSNGLPRVGLFDPASAVAFIEVAKDTYGPPKVDVSAVQNLPADMLSDLGRNIAWATGVSVVRTSSIDPCATSIALSAQYEGPVPPPAIVEILKTAPKSFDCVRVLADIKEWNVSYRSLQCVPVIQPSPVPVTDPDPLVVGFKTLDFPCEETEGKWSLRKECVAFLLGAFDESALEGWIRSEHTQRP
jgi:hypothetical protein